MNDASNLSHFSVSDKCLGCNNKQGHAYSMDMIPDGKKIYFIDRNGHLHWDWHLLKTKNVDHHHLKKQKNAIMIVILERNKV